MTRIVLGVLVLGAIAFGVFFLTLSWGSFPDDGKAHLPPGDTLSSAPAERPESAVARGKTGEAMPEPASARGGVPDTLRDRIDVSSPAPGDTVGSPMSVTGRARGPWYFEATFPLVLTDWDGRILAEGYAEAEGDWMTREFVPFRGSLTFTSPYQPGDPEHQRRGILILKNANASGRPELDRAVEVPVVFRGADPVLLSPLSIPRTGS